ncbi:phosphoglycerate mutase [[Pantoea] beijingensis]|uniref:Phosphoglycerate mutase n=1 Tax=[Pantoea] beijingensis TaxID=1324864 RepID=A0A443I9H9_9GAMM|nr:histidine phosphatase family protein [[Pantoea] beijingensis]RWR00798.1 phosphoglycerate mutase [[Pantoea] beijingensis]
MKRWLLSVLMVFIAINSPQLMAQTKDKSARDDVITIYFARHGKTLLNTFDRVQGWADSPLTDEGKQVARYLGEGLKEINFDRFYSSDAGRQRETMAVILQQAGVSDYHLTELTGLREAFFGSFEGGYNKDMANSSAHELGLADSKALFKAMKAGSLPVSKSQDSLAKSDPQHLAENYKQVKTRTQAALATIIENAKNDGDKNILVISSGTAIQIMISDLTNNPAKNLPLSNAAVVKIIYRDGKYSIPEIGTMKYVEAGKQALENN